MSADSEFAGNVLSRRLILEWRDECLVEAELGLSRVVMDLTPIIKTEVEKASSYELFIGKTKFCSDKIDPLINKRLAAELKRLENLAEAQLGKLIQKTAGFEQEEFGSKVEGGHWESALDFASAGAPVLLAAGALFATPALAVGSAAALLGLATTSVVSVPAIAVLVGGAAILGSTGLTRGLGLTQRQVTRVCDQILANMSLQIIGNGASEPDRSALKLYKSAISETAKQFSKEASHDSADTV